MLCQLPLSYPRRCVRADRLIVHFLNLLLSTETESRSRPYITVLSQLTHIFCAITSPVNALTSVIRARLPHDLEGWSVWLNCDWARKTDYIG